MMKTYPILVAKTWPVESLMWQMSKLPGCFSLQKRGYSKVYETRSESIVKSKCKCLFGWYCVNTVKFVNPQWTPPAIIACLAPLISEVFLHNISTVARKEQRKKRRIERQYLEIMEPTLPALAPPVTMARLPTSNLMMSCTLLVARSSWIVSSTWSRHSWQWRQGKSLTLTMYQQSVHWEFTTRA